MRSFKRIGESFGSFVDASKYNTVHAALEKAYEKSALLYFPPGIYNVASPLVLTRHINIAGCGEESEIRYTGTGHCFTSAFTNPLSSQFVTISQLKIEGTNAVGQGAVKLGDPIVGVSRANINNLYLESFGKGYAIDLEFPIECTVTQNYIGGCAEGIVAECATGCEFSKNWASYWADYGIRLFSITNALAPRNNKITQNHIHGNGVIQQLVLKDRAAIKLERMCSTDIDNNYIEIIKNPPNATTQKGHGIWIDGTTGLTQSNVIQKTNFGPGTEGSAIKLNGLTSHTSIEDNSMGTYDLEDSGLYTNFKMQYLSDIAQLVGTSTTRRGWIGLFDSVVQLHV